MPAAEGLAVLAACLLHLSMSDEDADGLLLKAVSAVHLSIMQAVSGAGLYALRSVTGLQSLNLSSCLELGDDDPLAALVYLTGMVAGVVSVTLLSVSDVDTIMSRWSGNATWTTDLGAVCSVYHPGALQTYLPRVLQG